METTPGRDRAVLLPSGRTLACLDLGDPAGRPVLYAHGGLSSRLDALALDAPARDLGLRVLAPDRPGVGGSSPTSRASLRESGEDAVALADALGLERVALLGWSAGGAHALAWALALRDRARGVALVGSLAPFDPPVAARDLGLRIDRVLYGLAGAPRLAALVLAVVARTPARALRGTLRREVSAADRAVLDALTPGELAAPTREALRPGVAGVLADYTLTHGAWGFRPEDVAHEVTVFQGAEDDLLPLAHAEALARRLPRARLEVVAGAGHFLLRAHAHAVLGALEHEHGGDR